MTGSFDATSLPGRLEVICGCMFTGKTTELIRRVRAARAAGAAVGVFRPASDLRTAPGVIATHLGESIDAVELEDAFTLPPAAHGFDVVAVDECHFFGEALGEACALLVEVGKRVIVAGVDLDHRGLPFEPFPRLLREAAEVARLTCPCAVCGGPAVHSQRMVEASERIVVGGREVYEPRCAGCFVPGRPLNR